MAEQDLYSILGVRRGAGADEIRKAYRKLARKHHPDVNPGDRAAEERFKEVSAANDVLSSPEKRKLYDEFGMAGLREGFDVARARQYQQWQQNGQDAADGSEQQFRADEFDLGDIFGEFFHARQGSSRPGGVSPSDSAVGQDLLATVEVDLAQALAGCDVRLEVPSAANCSACAGTGREAGAVATRCAVCNGSGRRKVSRGMTHVSSFCTKCGGSGEVTAPCRVCGGTGSVSQLESVTVRIPAGADNGSRLRVSGRGAAMPGGKRRGDLVIETRVRPHPYFRRDGLHLYLRLPVTLAEAYNGASVEVPTSSGVVRLRVPPRSQNGNELRLRGKGVHRGREHGDLYVTLDVRLPEGEDDELALALSRAEQRYARPVREGIRL